MRHLARGASSALLVGLIAGCGAHGSSRSSTTNASPDPGSLSIDRGNPGKGGGGGGRPPRAGTESVGNNLSNPMVFAEGYGITGISSTTQNTSLPFWEQTWTGLRIPTAGDPTLPANGTEGTFLLDGVTYYLQGTEQASWQATWLNGAGTATPWATLVKWGDNLLGEWTTTSTIHIEVAATSTSTMATLVPSPANVLQRAYFPTKALYGSGSTETYGTTGVPTDAASLSPGVYSENAYMIIAPLVNGVEGPAVHVLETWNRAVEGPSADALIPEINASGNVDYSYNWFAGRDTLQPGTYRLTFGVLLCSACTLPEGGPLTQTSGNMTINEVVVPSGAEGVPDTISACGSVPAGKVNCSTQTNTSYIDITLVSGSTIGGGHGSGHGGGGSGGGGGGSGGGI